MARRPPQVSLQSGGRRAAGGGRPAPRPAHPAGRSQETTAGRAASGGSVQSGAVGRSVVAMTAALRLSSLVLVALLCAAPLSAFPNGAPTEACLRGMLPNHRGARSGNIATMPFSITRQTTADGIRGENALSPGLSPHSVHLQCA